MTESSDRSLMDELESDPRAQVEIALADFVLRAEQLFEAALESGAPSSLAAVAAAVGVDEDRVRRIVRGEDSLTLEAFVRYMRAIGYELYLNAHPVAGSTVPELPLRIMRWPADVVDIYSQRAVTLEGVHETSWLNFRQSSASLPAVIENLQPVATQEGRTGRLLGAQTFEAVFTSEQQYEQVPGG